MARVNRANVMVSLTIIRKLRKGALKMQVDMEKAIEIYRDVYSAAAQHMSSRHANYTAQTAVDEHIEQEEQLAEERRERELEAVEA